MAGISIALIFTGKCGGEAQFLQISSSEVLPKPKGAQLRFVCDPKPEGSTVLGLPHTNNSFPLLDKR